ncbi:response regulator [Sulfurimonas sp. SAG-AH-194-I05]|nr:ATP-binding protein [Sulfurimonas sp. SAG-AH-194-I05]MDF1874151.1 response regulator [Sulfurimonas sp. SAG-AH-194-I05]
MQSLRIRFLFIFLFILTSLGLLLWNDSIIATKIDHYNKYHIKIKELQISYLNMRRAEKDFFARKNIKYRDKLLHIIDSVADDFNVITLGDTLNDYKSSFIKITDEMILVGLTQNSGLKKQFLYDAKRLEKDLTEDKHLNILMSFLILREHEKNFLLDHNLKFLKLHNKKSEEIHKDTRLKFHTKILLNMYNASFGDLTDAMQYIGLTENEALRGSMRTSAHAIETALENFISESVPIIKQEIESLQNTRFLIYSVLAIFIVMIFSIILRPVDKAFSIFSNFFKTFKHAKQRINVNSLKFTELKSVGSTINTMLQSREEFEDELIKSRDEAIRLQTIKEEFLTNMSHELRTPLNAIIGFSNILKNNIPKEGKLINPIVESSQHLLSLINDILDISKIQSGKFTLSNSIFNVKEKLESCVSQFNIIANEKNITFNVESNADTSLHIHSDWLRISQIINNFLSNAFKFTPENGTITFSLTYISNTLLIAVKDSGIGISQEAQQRILKPFEQADSSTTKKYGGTGLGLSICNSIAEIMGGTISIASKENEGSTFSFSLPVERAKNPNILPIEETLDVQESIDAHVLVVEDNKTNQMLLTMLLEDVEITYDIANDGLEAVSMYEDNKYDMVLMDENMPNMNGVDAMLKIRKEHNSVVPIIAVTANVMKGDEARLIDAGMDDFVAKPIDSDALIATIARHLKAKV